METRSRYELTIPVTVEFEDIDSYQIVHHTKLVAYLERARLRLLTGMGAELSLEGLAPVLYELQMRFRKPARLLDQLEVTAFVRDFDDYQLALGYRILRGGETLVRASSVIAFADLEKGTLTTLPGELRRTLESRAALEAEGRVEQQLAE